MIPKSGRRFSEKIMPTQMLDFDPIGSSLALNLSREVALQHNLRR
jgi:hypothetical protein